MLWLVKERVSGAVPEVAEAVNAATGGGMRGGVIMTIDDAVLVPKGPDAVRRTV